jgi:hypothetical protein
MSQLSRSSLGNTVLDHPRATGKGNLLVCDQERWIRMPKRRSITPNVASRDVAPSTSHPGGRRFESV